MFQFDLPANPYTHVGDFLLSLASNQTAVERYLKLQDHSLDTVLHQIDSQKVPPQVATPFTYILAEPFRELLVNYNGQPCDYIRFRAHTDTHPAKACSDCPATYPLHDLPLTFYWWLPLNLSRVRCEVYSGTYLRDRPLTEAELTFGDLCRGWYEDVIKPASYA